MLACTCVQAEAIKPQVEQAKSSGSPITIQLQEAFYRTSVPLHIDVKNNQQLNISVTITGQGPDKTILDCGYAWRAISVVGAGAVSVSNLTIQNFRTYQWDTQEDYQKLKDQFGKHN